MFPDANNAHSEESLLFTSMVVLRVGSKFVYMFNYCEQRNHDYTHRSSDHLHQITMSCKMFLYVADEKYMVELLLNYSNYPTRPRDPT